MSTDIEMQEIGIPIDTTKSTTERMRDVRRYRYSNNAETRNKEAEKILDKRINWGCSCTVYTGCIGISLLIIIPILFAVYWKPTLDETHDLIKTECFINSQQEVEGPCNGIRCIDCKSNDYPPCEPIFNSDLGSDSNQHIYCKLGPGNYWVISDRPQNTGDIFRLGTIGGGNNYDDGKRDCYEERICYVTPHTCYTLNFNVTYTLDYTTTSIVTMSFQRDYTKMIEIQNSYLVNSSTRCYVNPENGKVHFYPDIYLLFKILILVGSALGIIHIIPFFVLIYMHIKTKCLYCC